MKSVVIRTIDDFEKIDNETSEIEFVEYEGVFSFADDCILPAITFTRMDVFLEYMPKSIEKLGLYSCDFDGELLINFTNLKRLDITNVAIDLMDIKQLNKLEEINLNYCVIKNISEIVLFKNLKKISLIETNVDNFEFLLEMDKLEEVIVETDTYDRYRQLFSMLIEKGIIISDMMGGSFNEI